MWFPAPVLVSLVLAGLLGLGGCRPVPEAIDFDQATLRVRNTTSEAWADVEIRVNDHYRGAAPLLGPGGELVVPLRNLIAGFGQYFDPSRQAVQKVEVTATGAGGGPVELAWPRPRH